MDELTDQDKDYINDKFNEIDEVRNEILKITDWLKNHDLDKLSGSDITRAITRLSILRVNLSQALAEAIGDYDLSYVSRKIQYAKEYNNFKSRTDEKLTQKDLDSMTLDKIAMTLEREIENKRYSDGLKFLYDSSSTLIMALQSKLKLLINEKSEVRNYE